MEPKKRIAIQSGLVRWLIVIVSIYVLLVAVGLIGKGFVWNSAMRRASNPCSHLQRIRSSDWFSAYLRLHCSNLPAPLHPSSSVL